MKKYSYLNALNEQGILHLHHELSQSYHVLIQTRYNFWLNTVLPSFAITLLVAFAGYNIVWDLAAGITVFSFLNLYYIQLYRRQCDIEELLSYMENNFSVTITRKYLPKNKHFFGFCYKYETKNVEICLF